MMNGLRTRLLALRKQVAEHKRVRRLMASQWLRRWLPVLALGALGILGMWLTGSFLAGLHEDLQEEPFPMDAAILEMVRRHTPGWARGPLRFLTDLLHGRRWLPLVFAAWIAAGIWLWRRDLRREAGGLAVALVISTLSVAVAKIAFERPRPTVTWALISEPTYSFPSGHAAAAVVIYGMGAYLAWRLTRRWRVGLAAAAAAAFLALGTGYSRIYLGAHYPTDVLAGFAVGGIWLATGILTTETLYVLRFSTPAPGRPVVPRLRPPAAGESPRPSGRRRARSGGH